MKINQKIMLIRKSLDLTQSVFARKLGMNMATISRLETGKIQPGPKFSKRMKEVFDIDIFGLAVEDVIFERDKPFSMPAEAGQKIPVLGISDAGHGIQAEERGYPVGISDEWVSRPAGMKDGSAFAVRINDGSDSMYPALKPGMLVIVSPNLEWNNGDMCLIKTTEGDVNIKEVRQKGRAIELSSINAQYAKIILAPDEIEWIYPIVWWRRAK